MMRLDIDGTLSDPGLLTYRQLGFGRPIDDGRRIGLYRLTLDAAEFEGAIRDSFDQFVEENEEDDIQTGGSDSMPVLLENGYPRFRHLWKISPNELVTIVKEYLFLEFLEGCLGENAPDQCQFAVNTLDFARLEGEGVVIEGSYYSL